MYTRLTAMKVNSLQWPKCTPLCKAFYLNLQTQHCNLAAQDIQVPRGSTNREQIESTSYDTHSAQGRACLHHRVEGQRTSAHHALQRFASVRDGEGREDVAIGGAGGPVAVVEESRRRSECRCNFCCAVDALLVFEAFLVCEDLDCYCYLQTDTLKFSLVSY